jgi:hypothetical protein
MNLQLGKQERSAALRWPWRGGPLQSVSDGFAESFDRDRHDGNPRYARYVEPPQHGKQIGRGLAQIAPIAEIEMGLCGIES